MKAVNAWFSKKERDDHKQAGIDSQKAAQHDATEQSRQDKRQRDQRLDSDSDLADSVRDAFRDVDGR